MFKHIKYLALLFALTYPAQASQLQSKQFYNLGGGLSAHVSPFLIQEGAASQIVNLSLDSQGQLIIRSGYDFVGRVSTFTAVTGGGYHNPASGNNFFAVVVGTGVYRTSNSFGGSFTNVTSTVTVTNSRTNLAQHTALNDVIVFCNESDAPFRVTASTSAYALGNAPSGAKTCSTLSNYLVLGNTTESGTAYPSRIRWSDINTTESWPALNFIDVEPNDGDKIVSIVSFDDSVYIFKKRSIYRMLITGQDGPDAFIIRPVVRNIGAWAKNSVRVLPNVGIVFLAQNTVYVLNDAGLDPIGHDIQETIDLIQRTEWGNAIGAVYPKHYEYWLAVSTSGTTNSTVLVYNYVQKVWTTYDGMHVNMLEQAESSTGDNVLISGDYLGSVYKQDTGTADYPGDVQTPITMSYTTGDITFGVPELTKNFKYLYLVTKADLNADITVQAYYDYDTSAVTTLPIPVGTSSAEYDTAIYDTDRYPNTAIAMQRTELNRSAKAIKLKFTASTSDANINIIGWSLVYTPEDYRD